MTLIQVKSFMVPREIITHTENSLRAAGQEGYELFVLWSGIRQGAEFNVRHAHVPRQSSYRTSEGLLVRVEGDALHKLNVWLFDNQEQLAAQIHAHPTDAYHSSTDDAFAIAAQLGSLSVVAADFCAHGLIDESTAAYRLNENGWSEIASPLDQVVAVVD